jgi:peptidoglycan/LPS O-acetylase OafA/YrhL
MSDGGTMTATPVADTRAETRIPSLDGIRALAIIIVFMGHAGLNQILRDTTGVTIFFFLSGYLITTLLGREHDRTGRIALTSFYKRRVFRILPAMYLVLAVAIVLNLLGLLKNTMTLAGAAASSLQFTNYWIILNGRDDLPVGMNALWSLNVEEHFYLLFPLLFIVMSKWLTRRQQLVILLALCACFMVWRVYLNLTGAGIDRTYLATDTRADSILWGCLFAIGWNPATGNGLPKAKQWASGYFLAGAAGLYFVRESSARFADTVGYTVEAVSLMLIFTAVISAPTSLFGRILNWRPLAFLGVLSYSLYLIHRLVLFFVAEHTNLSTVPVAAVSFVVSLVLSYVVYRFVEKPMIRLGKSVRFKPMRAAETH